MTAPFTFSDEEVCGMTAATSTLYVIAALDEVETAHRVFGAELRRIRRKYIDELTEPDRFALLRLLGQRLAGEEMEAVR